jgi:microcystin-dependent protein
MEGTIGEIRMCAFDFAPRGWAFCHGQTIAINDYQALYSLIGTLYGGNGRTTLMLPDFRGRAPLSAGQGAGLSLRQLGELGGSEKVPLDYDQMPLHNHLTDWVFKNGAASGVVELEGTTATKVSREEGDVIQPDGAIWGKFSPQQFDPFVNASEPNFALMDEQKVQVSGSVELQITSIESTVATGEAGGSEPVYVMQPWIATHYIICLDGLYPSRN